MQGLVRDGMKAGALGLSVFAQPGPVSIRRASIIPAVWADEKEIFALGDVLRGAGHPSHPPGGGVNGAEMKDGR